MDRFRAFALASLSLAVVVSALAFSAGSARAETRTLNLYYTHTKERAKITFKRNGRYDKAGLRKLNRFLRDWRRKEPTRMDPALFDLVWEVYQKSGSRKPIHVISAYRSPRTNNMLRRRGRKVARNSQHTRGKAMDFFLPDVPVSKLRALGLKQHRGGVGYYRRSFVHLDTGRVRHWPRMSRRQLSKVFPRGRTIHVPSNGKPLRGYKTAMANLKRGRNADGSSRRTRITGGGGGGSLLARLFARSGNDGDEGEVADTGGTIIGDREGATTVTTASTRRAARRKAAQEKAKREAEAKAKAEAQAKATAKAEADAAARKVRAERAKDDAARKAAQKARQAEERKRLEEEEREEERKRKEAEEATAIAALDPTRRPDRLTVPRRRPGAARPAPPVAEPATQVAAVDPAILAPVPAPGAEGPRPAGELAATATALAPVDSVSGASFAALSARASRTGTDTRQQSVAASRAVPLPAPAGPAEAVRSPLAERLAAIPRPRTSAVPASSVRPEFQSKPKPEALTLASLTPSDTGRAAPVRSSAEERVRLTRELLKARGARTTFPKAVAIPSAAPRESLTIAAAARPAARPGQRAEAPVPSGLDRPAVRPLSLGAGRAMTAELSLGNLASRAVRSWATASSTRTGGSARLQAPDYREASRRALPASIYADGFEKARPPLRSDRFDLGVRAARLTVASLSSR